MKMTNGIGTDPGERHIGDNAIVSLIDKHGQCIWTNLDPTNNCGRGSLPVLDTVVPEDRAKVREALGQCLLESQVLRYNVRGYYLGDTERLLAWHVTLLPVPLRSDGTVACCAISHILPANHAEFSADERLLLNYLAADKTLKEAAILMHRSVTAIDNKIKTLKEKLRVQNIGGLVAAAIVNHII